MNTNVNAVTVHMPDGSTETQILDHFVNSRTAAIEAARQAPPLYKANLYPVVVDPDECVLIEGRSYLKASARNRIANAAGVRQYGQPQIVEFERDGKTWTRVTVGLVRPPMHTDPVYRSAEGAISECKNAKERQFFLAKLQTQAHTRALKEVLGDDFAYNPQEIKQKEGRFLVACVTPDNSDPDVRAIAIERMRGAESQLYPSPQLPRATADDPMMLPTIDESVLDDPEFGEEVGGQDAEPPTASAALDPLTSASEADTLPLWTSEFNLSNGAPVFDSVPEAKLEQIVRGELKRIKYDGMADPADIVSHGKAGDWVTVAGLLLAWQLGGGSNA